MPRSTRKLFQLVVLSKRRFIRGQHRAFVVLGAPGVGKGTFSKRIAREFDANVITSGDILRRAAYGGSKDTDRGRYLQQCIASGSLVPDHIVLPMVVDEIKEQPKSFILDGFPRTVHQAQQIYSTYHLDLVVYFKLPDEILVKKALGRRVCSKCGQIFNVASICEGDIVMPSMQSKKEGICDDCGNSLCTRVDDTAEVILQRLGLFHQVTSPLVKFYKEKGALLEFDIKTGINDTVRLLSDIKKFLGH